MTSLLGICGCLIDLDKVLWLDYNKTKDRAWVVMQGVTWNAEGDYYDNAPYLNNEEDVRKFERDWAAYCSRDMVTTCGSEINLKNI